MLISKSAGISYVDPWDQGHKTYPDCSSEDNDAGHACDISTRQKCSLKIAPFPFKSSSSISTSVNTTETSCCDDTRYTVDHIVIGHCIMYFPNTCYNQHTISSQTACILCLLQYVLTVLIVEMTSHRPWCYVILTWLSRYVGWV